MLGNAVLVNEPVEVDKKLKSLGLTRSELKTVAQKAVSARNESVSIDPINAPGTLAYIHGVRALRELLLSKPDGGWERDTSENMEVTYNRDLGVKILYQNVDKACSPVPPQPISKKGNGAKRLVGDQIYLFPEMEEEDKAYSNTEVWFFCVSVKDEDFRAELSRPGSIEGSQFGDFVERIYVVTKDPWSPDVSDEPTTIEAEMDTDFEITRK